MGPREALLQLAQEASERAYSPYSGFRVGAAVSCGRDGATFQGCNIENASYSLTICAERSAVAAAVSSGRRDLAAMAIFAEGEHLPMPCGACRQFLAEFNPDLEITVSNGRGSRHYRLSELLPHSFGKGSLPSS